MIISFDYSSFFKEYFLIESQIRQLKQNSKTLNKNEEYNNLIKKLENRKSFLKAHLKNFKVSFKTILEAIFPDFDPKYYIIESSPFYGLRTLKPLDTNTLYSYLSRTKNFDKGIFIEITVKSKKTLETFTFYKSFDLDNLLEDNTPIKNNLKCITTTEKDSKLFLNSLYVNPQKIYDLIFDFIDFKYNSTCKVNIDAIFKHARKKQIILNNENNIK